MRFFKQMERREKTAWTISFLTGFVPAVAVFCLFSEKLVVSSGFLEEAFFSKIRYLDINQNGLFLYSLKSRLETVAFLVLLAAAGMAGIGNCLFLGWSGFCAGALLTTLCMRCGFSGIILFLGCILPQQLLFIPGFLLLLHWCEQKKEAKRLLLSLLVVIMACFLESYVNPVVLKVVLNIFLP